MNVIDLFSGVGGFSTGLKKAGFKTILANEIDKQIATSYKKNHPSTLVINADINDLIHQFEELIHQNCISQGINSVTINQSLKKVDLIVGGPPCQGFSMAGRRIRKHQRFIEDPRNYLFESYFKIIQKFEPNFFIFENVIGIKSMDQGQILAEIEAIFQDANNFKKGSYFLQKKVFSADEYGVPQKRKRFILIGSKYEFDLEETITLVKEKLKVTNPYFNQQTTVADAISDLNFNLKNTTITEYKLSCKTPYQLELRRGVKLLHNHIPPNHSDIVIDRMKRIKKGENWSNLKERDSIKSVHSGAYGRLEWNTPSFTITTRFDTPTAGRYIHPDLNRNITPREAARLQSFPDNTIFYGTKSSICKQIGNAVPPMLAEFLGHIIMSINSQAKNTIKA